MKKTLTRNTLGEILNHAGLDAEDIIYGWESGSTGYSGRGMYGSSCFALSTSNLGHARQFFQGVGRLLQEVEGTDHALPEELADLNDMASNVSTDQLGRGTVYYFQGWGLEPEEGA